MDEDFRFLGLIIGLIAIGGFIVAVSPFNPISSGPTEPETSQPETENPSENPETPSDEPETPPEERETPPEDPENVKQPQNEEPETPSSEPETPEEQSVIITITNLTPSIEAKINGATYDVNNKPSFKAGETIHIYYKNKNTNKTYENDYSVVDSGNGKMNIKDEAMENALLNNNPSAVDGDDFPAAFYLAEGYDEEIRRYLDEGARISFDDLFN